METMIEIRYSYPIPGLRDRMVSSEKLSTRELKARIRKLRARRKKAEAELCELDDAALRRRAADCVVLLERERHLQQEIDKR